MMTRFILFFCAALMLSGCGLRERLFGGGVGQAASALPFRTSLARGEDRRDFAVRVQAGGVSVDDVRESVRFEATRYCLANYGASDTRWAMDAATDDWAFTRDGRDMIFNGRCVAR